MQIRVLSRSRQEHFRERQGDLFRVSKNADPQLHPFEREREFVRALNATKLEKMFAKPFLGALNGHYDGIMSIAKHPSALSTIASGDMSGELRTWAVSSFSCTGRVQAHSGFVRGVAFASRNRIITAGDDKMIHEWEYPIVTETQNDTVADGMILSTTSTSEKVASLSTFTSEHPFSGLDVQRGTQNSVTFATSGGNVVEVWDRSKSNGPIRQFEWGTESVHSVKFNPIETQILASSAGDRSIALYDIRMGSAIHKVVLVMKTNAVAWNPIEAFNFTSACEDGNLYSFDMRKLSVSKVVHEGHVAAVMDVDYSPTGKEFVSGSYDRTVRIWELDQVKSRDTYHTTRMQHIFVVKCTDDSRYVLTGSDDANIRVWKMKASEPLRMISKREQAKLDYNEKIKRRFAMTPEIRRITLHQRVPKAVFIARKRIQRHNEAVKTHHEHALAHSKPGALVFKTRSQAPVVTDQN